VPIPSPTTPAPQGAVTVRGLAPELKTRLRVRAAHHGRSMEAEARAILEAALAAPEEDLTDLAAFARGLFAPLGGAELELPPREPARDPPVLGLGPAEEHQPAAGAGTAAPSLGKKAQARSGTTPPSPARRRRGR